MSGNLMTVAHDIVYSEPYMNQSFAFIVEDHRKDDFASTRSIMKLDSLRVGILNMPYYVDKLQRYLPHAEIIILNSPREYFKNKDLDLDAFLYTAEAGSAWSMIYPEYDVVVPFDRITQVPVSFSLAKGRGNFYDSINRWILLKTADKTIDRIADYWIYGQLKELKQPRWCVARDVLHWYE
jgi:ABC-type amino acid transport substrate-binding protein